MKYATMNTMSKGAVKENFNFEVTEVGTLDIIMKGKIYKFTPQDIQKLDKLLQESKSRWE